MNYADQLGARTGCENNTVNSDRERSPGNPIREDLWTEVNTRQVQLLLALRQSFSDSRTRQANEWGMIEGLYRKVEKALETDDLEELKQAKAAYERLPEAAYRLVQPWASRPEPSTRELLKERGDHGVLCFMDVVGGEYAPSTSYQMYEPPYLFAGGLAHDFFAGQYMPVRVQIHELTDKETALDILREMVTFIELNWDKMAAGGTPYSQDCNWTLTPEDSERIAEEDDSPLRRGWFEE